MLKLSDARATTLVKQMTVYYTYIAICGDKIYLSDTSAVTCYTIKGEKLWEYKDVSVLKDPRV